MQHVFHPWPFKSPAKPGPIDDPNDPSESEPDDMRDLAHELRQLCQRNRDGSFTTQADRQRMLRLMAEQLEEMGYKHMAAASLKPQHV